MAPKFSIIVPVCNSAKGLDKLFESIVAQSWSDFEVLLIVEYSTDNSLERCRRQMETDPRFRVFELPQSGSASVSRNWGIKKALGEYVFFIMSYAWLEPDALQRAAELIETTGCPDLMITSANEFEDMEDGSLNFVKIVQNLPDEAAGTVFSGEELIVRSWNFRGNSVCYTHLLICKIKFLRDNELYQLPGVLQEDTDWVPRVWYYAKTATVLPRAICNCRKHEYTHATTGELKKLLDMSTILATQFTFIDEIQAPENVARILSNQVLSQFYWYLFYPQYRNKFTTKQRVAALHKVLSRNIERFRRISALSNIPKRVAIPLVMLAYEYNWFLPANLYFSYLYYPLSKLRKS